VAGRLSGSRVLPYGTPVHPGVSRRARPHRLTPLEQAAIRTHTVPTCTETGVGGRMAKSEQKKGGKRRGKWAPPVVAEPRETPVVQFRMSQAEYDERVARVRAELERRELDALVLFHPIRMAYTSGFYHVSTERPMAIV